MVALGLESFFVSFAAASVEWVEAFTLVLAAALTVGWRRASEAALAGLAVIAALIVATHGALAILTQIEWLRVAIGAFLILFGLRWYVKAIARSAGIRPVHDEEQAFVSAREQLKLASARMARVSAFNAVVVEGLEVWLIVVALGTARDAMAPAAAGALTALLVVTLAGLLAHKPLSRVPENALKFGVACALLGLGSLWYTSALSPAAWPWSDGAVLVVMAAYAASGQFLAFLKGRFGGGKAPSPSRFAVVRLLFGDVRHLTVAMTALLLASMVMQSAHPQFAVPVLGLALLAGVMWLV